MQTQPTQPATQPVDTTSDEFREISRRARNAAIIGGFIGVPVAWSISVATGISFDSVIATIAVLGGVGLFVILKRGIDTGGEL